jgi:NADPH-dependent ferric siderophore reductase
MPRAPAVIGNLVESAMGRTAQLLDVSETAPGFLEVELHAEPPPGGWHPGHEIQIRATPTQGRRYSVRTVGGTDADRIAILAATEAEGPGTAWIRRLRVGSRTTVLAGRHRPLRENGTRRLYLGDGCTLGTLDACAQSQDAPIVTVEVPESAVEPLAARWPRYRFLPAVGEPGDALQLWLEQAVSDDELGNLDGAVLLGHAQSIQRQRQVLTDSLDLPRRAITTRPYWATGRTGL